MKKQGEILKPNIVPFQGGCNTVLESEQIPMGGYSMVQNMRDTHPGKKKRAGQRKLHTTADSTNSVMTLYQFSKGERDEKQTYAQMSDSDVLKATTDPPGVTTGVFGSEAFSGSASPKPASWGNIRDTLIFSNGVDQHQIYTGSVTYIDSLVVYDGAEAPPNVPTVGRDYTDEATDGLTTTAVILDSLDTYANFECIFIMAPVPIDAITLTVSKANGNASVLSGYYWNGSWTQVAALSDGTDTGGATLAKTGTVTFTLPTDSYPNYMYGLCGYWYQFRVSAQLDAEVEVTSATFNTDWQDIENVWDSFPVDVVETQFETAANVLDENCSSIAAWTDSDAGDGTSTQVFFDEQETFKLDAGTAGAGNDAIREQDVGSFAENLTVEIKIYCDLVGAVADGDAFILRIDKSGVRVQSAFASDGLFVYDGAGYNEVGTNIVTQDTWQTWKFVCDFSTPASATCDVYLNDALQASGVDCSHTGSYTEGTATLFQNGDATAHTITHVDFITIGNTESKTYKTYGATSIEIDSMTSMDKVYIASSDKICGIYVDVGSKPNTTAGATVNAVYYWNGTAWASVGTISDGTNGLSNSGWVTFPRTSAHERQFNENQYYAYWYYFTVDQTLNDDVIVSLLTMPYFDIADFGKGRCNCVWKERVVYAFDRDHVLFVSALKRPQALNGIDYGPIEPGDGRKNLVVSMRRFYNELMVWQEEKGVEGGCLTLVEGYSPSTYGTVLLSTKIGTLNAKTTVVVDGVYTSTETDEIVATLAFWISHYGVFKSGGQWVTGVSDDIQNYFDPLKSECLRRGCEDQMWIGHDTSYNVLRLGIVSGESVQTSTATSTTADKLVDTAGAFTTRKTVTGHPISHTIAIGDTVYNTTDSTSALITAIDSATILSLDSDIMVSGEGYKVYSATCNLFPVFDLAAKEFPWSFDLYQQNPSCFAEVEAGSDNAGIIQMSGGTKDGFIYQSNYGSNDISTAIVSYVDVELNANGREMELDEVLLTLKKGGHLTITPYMDGAAQTSTTETAIANVRNKYDMNYRSTDMKVRFENNTAGESFHLFGFGFRLYSNETR